MRFLLKLGNAKSDTKSKVQKSSWEENGWSVPSLCPRIAQCFQYSGLQTADLSPQMVMGREDEGWEKAALFVLILQLGGMCPRAVIQLTWFQLLLACSSAQVLALTGREQRVYSWLSLGHVLAKEMPRLSHGMERFTKETL